MFIFPSTHPVYIFVFHFNFDVRRVFIFPTTIDIKYWREACRNRISSRHTEFVNCIILAYVGYDYVRCDYDRYDYVGYDYDGYDYDRHDYVGYDMADMIMTDMIVTDMIVTVMIVTVMICRI